MNVTTTLESIQEQWVTPLVENDNQQQIYRLVRKHILLPSGRGHYTDWELCQSIDFWDTSQPILRVIIIEVPPLPHGLLHPQSQSHKSLCHEL